MHVYVDDEADDAKAHKQNVGQGEGIDGIGELLDLSVAWSGELCGSPIPEKSRQVTGCCLELLEAPCHHPGPKPFWCACRVRKATTAETHFSV